MDRANALFKQKKKGHCLGDWLEVSKHVAGVLQGKPGDCLLTGRNGWHVLGGFCPHDSQHLFQMCGYPKEEPAPAVIWEGEEGERNKPRVLVSVTV